MAEDLGTRILTARGLKLPFRLYWFEGGRRRWLVFYCLWEERAGEDYGSTGGEAMTRRGRLRAVTSGERHLGQIMIEAAVQGQPDVAAATRELETFLEGAVRPATEFH